MEGDTEVSGPGFERMTRICHLVGVAFLVAQLAAIGYARFNPERYFCWAPYDEHTFYTIEVEVDGRKLSKSEIADRYRYYPGGWEPRSIHNVISQVSQFESTYGVDDGAKIVIEYETNGHPKRRWEWPVR